MKRVAVTGVYRNLAGHSANIVDKRLRSRGYNVFAVSANAQTAEGDRAYPDLKSITGGVGAAGDRDQTGGRRCHHGPVRQTGDQRVWMHRSKGTGSVSRSATELGRMQAIKVIEGGCQLMVDPTGDFGHTCTRFVLSMSESVPKHVSYASRLGPVS
jgi:hypothetical protein